MNIVTCRKMRANFAHFQKCQFNKTNTFVNILILKYFDIHINCKKKISFNKKLARFMPYKFEVLNVEYVVFVFLVMEPETRVQ